MIAWLAIAVAFLALLGLFVIADFMWGMFDRFSEFRDAEPWS